MEKLSFIGAPVRRSIIELSITFDERYEAVSFRMGDTPADVASQLRLLAKNIERNIKG